MYEIEELRKKIEAQDYIGALQIIDEIDEMSKEDKLNKIYSYMVILLLHLIKQQAEQRTTSSWDRSIFNSIDNINRTNKRRKSGGHYANSDVLKEIIDEAYPRAIKEASFEAFEGKLTVDMLEEKVDLNMIKKKALSLLECN
ncbi:DUF29 family protein [Crocosphaera sp.]|uniref:DUF29 family protein n=1 Tax=Crocosphaera sp. TaxID=2729996 RepID=UPI002610973D|nr:DUF29 family protein [Crocosphaera sp.]MDJ0579720.1 DUF29 family protein [Crocosphaera sp.]